MTGCPPAADAASDASGIMVWPVLTNVILSAVTLTSLRSNGLAAMMRLIASNTRDCHHASRRRAIPRATGRPGRDRAGEEALDYAVSASRRS
jgi:hypothetical protein